MKMAPNFHPLGVHRFFFRRFCSTSYYVTKVRQVDQWKRRDDSLQVRFTPNYSNPEQNDYRRGRFMLSVNRTVFMHKVDGQYAIKWMSHKELTAALAPHDLPSSIEHTVLLDATTAQTDGYDVEMEFVPQMAFALNIRDNANCVCDAIGADFDGRFLDTRAAMLSSSADGATVLAKAQSLFNWHRTYRHCPRCTTPLHWTASRATATCHKCVRSFYPQVSPVSICLLRNLQNTHLFLVNLPRGTHPRLYTCVAGFADPGETLESTTRREVAEEVGLDLIDIRHMHLTQPWPFPFSSLMCAFVATADMRHQFDIDRHELNGGGWFDREEVRQAFERINRDPRLRTDCATVESELVFVPPRNTMAHEMIKKWLNNVKM